MRVKKKQIKNSKRCLQKIRKCIKYSEIKYLSNEMERAILVIMIRILALSWADI